MIRINLLRQLAVKRKRRFRIPRSVVVPTLAIAGAAVLAVGIVTGLRILGRRRPAPPEYAIQEPPVPPATARRRIVEDVVRDIHDSQLRIYEHGLLRLPYPQLTLEEKINYEILFAKHVFELLARAIPREVRFRSLEFSDYHTVYANGLARSRSAATAMLGNLSGSTVRLLKPPFTRVEATGDGEFRFVLSATFAPGLDLTDPVVDLSLGFLPERNGLPQVIRRVRELARGRGLVLIGPLDRRRAEIQGRYGRFHYSLTAQGTYLDFVAFVVEIYRQRIPCSFQTCTVTARSGTAIDISARIIFTTKR